MGTWGGSSGTPGDPSGGAHWGPLGTDPVWDTLRGANGDLGGPFGDPRGGSLGALGDPFVGLTGDPLGTPWGTPWGLSGNLGRLSGDLGDPLRDPLGGLIGDSLGGTPLGGHWGPLGGSLGIIGDPLWGAHWGPLGSLGTPGGLIGDLWGPPGPPLTGAAFPPQAMSAPPAPPEEPPLSPPVPGVSGVSGGGPGGGGGRGAAPLSAASLSRLRSRLRGSPASCGRSGGPPVSCPPPFLLHLLPSLGGNPRGAAEPPSPGLGSAGSWEAAVWGAGKGMPPSLPRAVGGEQPPPGLPRFLPPARASLGREQRGGAESAGGMGGAGGDPARYC